ncbi:MAG: YciI family protein [Candidatus Heimdallarchaeota archaeon]
MTEIEHYIAIIKPIREDFLINSTEEDEKIMGEHFEYLKKLLASGELVLAGPALNEVKPFGLVILKCNSLEKAKDIMTNDPSVKSGMQNLKLVEPFKLSLYNPPPKK